MMEHFEQVLAVGGKSNSLGRAGEVVGAVLDDRSRLRELYACMLADDPWVRMRAADSFEKICRVHPEWIAPYVGKIFRDLTGSTQPSVQWHLAQIFPRVELTGEQKSAAVAWLKRLLETTDVDWIVAVNAMKALLEFRQSGLVADDELRTLFEVQAHHASKSVRRKTEVFAKKLEAGA